MLAEINPMTPTLDFFSTPRSNKIEASKDQTDKTDMSTTQRSTWWSVTAFGDEMAVCEGTLPDWVRAMYGGREICPETQREHFQGALQLHEQARMSKVKTWLKTAHLEPARSVEALKKYAMKPDTSSGQKLVRENPQKFYKAHDLMLLLARTARQPDMTYYARVRVVLAGTPELAGQLMNPSLRNFWEQTHSVWLAMAEDRAGDSITPALGTFDCNGCGKDECEACYLKEQELETTIQHGTPPQDPTPPTRNQEDEGTSSTEETNTIVYL